MNFLRPSALRRNGCCLRLFVYCVCCLSLFLIVYIMVKNRLQVIDKSFVQLDKCPACFGKWESVCQAISFEKLKVWGNYFWKSESLKGVWYGKWNELPVVLKQLGHIKELAMLDQEICLNTSVPVSKHCDVGEKVLRSFLNPAMSFKSALMQFMECPTMQFVKIIESNLKNENDVVRLDQKIMAMTNLHFNQEFLFLQVFSERYSNFLPAVYGACGRVIVVENVGPTLSSVLSWSWQERVKVSIKLIQLARQFTRTEDNMALYMYDVAMDNYAVDRHGNVKLIDCEHVLVVDMKAFNRSYSTKSEDLCTVDRFQCLTFVPEDLCKGQAQDHNYYAICRNLLAAVGNSRGLLHSPEDKDIQSRLKYLLDNCIYSKEMSREHAVEILEKQLLRYVTYDKGDRNT